MRMAAPSECCVAAATAGIVLGSDARPVVDGGSQAAGACLTHLNTAGFATPLCHRRHTSQGAQGMVISRLDGLMSLREQRGEIVSRGVV